MDLSNLKFLTDFKAGMVYFNGTLKFLQDVRGNVALNLTSERFHRGKWIPGEFKFFTEDYCKFINNPLGQPIVYVTAKKALKGRTCPFNAGVRSFIILYPFKLNIA